MLGYLALTGDISWAHPARSIVPLSAQMICRRGVVAVWQIGKISTWLLLLVLLGVSLGPGYSPKFLSMSLTLQLRTVAIKPMFFGCMRKGGKTERFGAMQCEVFPSIYSTKFNTEIWLQEDIVSLLSDESILIPNPTDTQSARLMSARFKNTQVQGLLC